MKKILSLCDLSGVMVKPWLDNGYECWIVDMQHPDGITRDGNLVKVGCMGECLGAVLDTEGVTYSDFAICFAFPTCTDLCVSGARWWKQKGQIALRDALQLVFKCQDIINWVGKGFIENPVGRLSTEWRKPDYLFNPCDYAGYLSDTQQDAYTKKTCLWTTGNFKMPEKKFVTPNKVCAQGSWIQKLGGKSLKTKNLRSKTPEGFAVAVYEANKNYI